MSEQRLNEIISLLNRINIEVKTIKKQVRENSQILKKITKNSLYSKDFNNKK